MDGHIMRCGTIGSSQSAATSEIVKPCWSRVHSCKWRYSKYPDLYLYLYHYIFYSVCIDRLKDLSFSYKFIAIVTVHFKISHVCALFTWFGKAMLFVNFYTEKP